MKWTYMAANSDLLDHDADRERLVAIAAERERKPPEEWTLFGDRLGAGGRAMLRLFESQGAHEFDIRLLEIPALKERLEKLSPSRYFSGLRAKLIIVHLASDPCIPSVESRLMAEAAKAQGVPYSLTILNIYGHTQPEWPDFGIRSFFGIYLPETWKFMRALHEVMSYRSPSAGRSNSTAPHVQD